MRLAFPSVLVARLGVAVLVAPAFLPTFSMGAPMEAPAG